MPRELRRKHGWKSAKWYVSSSCRDFYNKKKGFCIRTNWYVFSQSAREENWFTPKDAQTADILRSEDVTGTIHTKNDDAGKAPGTRTSPFLIDAGDADAAMKKGENEVSSVDGSFSTTNNLVESHTAAIHTTNVINITSAASPRQSRPASETTATASTSVTEESNSRNMATTTHEHNEKPLPHTTLARDFLMAEELRRDPHVNKVKEIYFNSSNRSDVAKPGFMGSLGLTLVSTAEGIVVFHY